MAKKHVYSRALRKLAVRLLRNLVRDPAVTHADREDLVTALVRQWISYDGNAMLFIGTREHYLVLDRNRPDQCTITRDPGPSTWIETVQASWKLRSEQLPEIISKLNRGQSAETTNRDGAPVRLWVDPRVRGKFVEPLVPRPAPAERPKDYYLRVAANSLSRVVGVAARDREAFAASVARQWQASGNHASLFLDGEQQLVLTLTEGRDGCNVTATTLHASIATLLHPLGFSAAEIPDVIAHINLGQPVEFRDRDGFPSSVWYEPEKRRLAIQTNFPKPQPGGALPTFCPRCRAIMLNQTCPVCGHGLIP